MSSKSILVVEDERIIAADIRASLERMGYSVISEAATGEEAIKAAMGLKPDLVLMDIILKGDIDGIVAAKQIFERFNIPVVYLTSHSDDATLKRAKASGPFGYILKPFSRQDLHAAIELALFRHEMQEKLKDREQRLFTTLKSIGDAVIVSDVDENIEYINPAAEALTGWDVGEAAGKKLSEVFKLVDRASGRQSAGFVEAVLKEGVSVYGDSDAVLVPRSGEEIPIEKNAAPIKDERGSVTGIVLVFRDITERRMSLAALEESERFLNTTFDSIRDPFCVLDRDFRIIRANEEYSLIKKMRVDEMVGETCFRLFEGREAPCQGCVVEKTFATGDSCAKEKHLVVNGADKWVEIYTYPMYASDGTVTHVIEYTRDITDRKVAEEERKALIKDLEHISKVDPLTGILNRRALMESLQAETERAGRYKSNLSVILCDIDRFKEMNDTYGHSAGDRALETVAWTLKQAVRKSDTVGRYGGDEFMVILPETTLEGAEDFAERIRVAVEKMVYRPKGKNRVDLSLSLGVSGLKPSGDNPDALIKRADKGLYESKKMGRNRVTASAS